MINTYSIPTLQLLELGDAISNNFPKIILMASKCEVVVRTQAIYFVSSYSDLLCGSAFRSHIGEVLHLSFII